MDNGNAGLNMMGHNDCVIDGTKQMAAVLL